MVDVLKNEYLADAEREGRFEWHEPELHIVRMKPNLAILYDKIRRDGNNKDLIVDKGCSDSRAPLECCGGSVLRCYFQSSRPQHISGQQDYLPFENATAARELFLKLDLPSSYFLIAGGSPAACYSQTQHDKTGRPLRYELAAHCVTKRGDWALVVSHRVDSADTSVFWSVDGRMDAKFLLSSLKNFEAYTFHPMLIPCIMFADTLRMNKERRADIKDKLRRLENAVVQMNRKPSFHASELDFASLQHSGPQYDVEGLFKSLHGCRKDQESQEGRRELWQSFHDALVEGFKYAEVAVVDFADSSKARMHYDLDSWAKITWKTLQSLHARDEDHIRRVNHVAAELGNIIQQRETRLHATIARAAQRDSEDMKFIAVLGSIFLPASLIATIFNVPQFQFLPGAKLFAVYLGITIPLIGVVVILCLSKDRWTVSHDKPHEIQDQNITHMTGLCFRNDVEVCAPPLPNLEAACKTAACTQQTARQPKQHHISNPEPHHTAKMVAESPEFKKAVEDSRKLKSKPNNDQLLELYAYFKEGRKEKAEEAGMFDLKGKAKYKAWKEVNEKNLSAEEAQKHYVELVEKLKNELGYEG
ncbi:hypothetical protein AC578_4997 [Pseudocercospora eumusae]|uniref:ACB domain-containing protein n=1 Tax=Pseudocercospora eumusae TaxID=321146 RepID=A0A139H961_9PEZI|nr:hypothetical protein AC578_4997 [Pseudocercospora eumusae]